MSQNDRRMAFVMPIFTHDGVGPAFNAADPEAALSVIERFRGACLAGLNGEMAIDAAMGAVQLKHGETPPPLTGVQLISEAHYANTEMREEACVAEQAGDLTEFGKEALTGLAFRRDYFDHRVEEAFYANMDTMEHWSDAEIIRLGEACAAALDARQALRSELEKTEEPPRLDDAHE